ncbi:MAG TPA: hypothetical protein PLD02_05555 [Saprospiraceae bacterium]|nr:hypothetical protein [Saprospiraceae bacterium]
MIRKIIDQLNLVGLILLLLVIVCCNKKSDCCTLIDVDLRIFYQDSSGHSLINSNPFFQASNIQIYFKNGDQFEYAFDSNLDNPNHFYVETIQSKEILRLFPSNFYKENRSTTLIALNKAIVDTLVCEFDFNNNNTILKQAWLNGVEIKNRYIEVKK